LKEGEFMASTNIDIIDLSCCGTPGGSGDVVGPAVSVNNTLPRFDGTTGKLLKASNIVVDDSDNLTIPGNFTVNGTTTILNTSVLDVEDKNITVNKGGNTAGSVSSGIDIEGTAAAIVGYFRVDSVDNSLLQLKASTGQDLKLNVTSPATLTINANATITDDHGSLVGLSDDDHTQYAKLLGRASGQNLIGGVAASENLTFNSTSHATKGNIILGSTTTTIVDELNSRLGVGVAAPGEKFHVVGNAAFGATKNFFWDNANSRLGIGTLTPEKALHVVGDVNVGNSSTTTNTLNFDNTNTTGSTNIIRWDGNGQGFTAGMKFICKRTTGTDFETLHFIDSVSTCDASFKSATTFFGDQTFKIATGAATGGGTQCLVRGTNGVQLNLNPGALNTLYSVKIHDPGTSVNKGPLEVVVHNNHVGGMRVTGSVGGLIDIFEIANTSGTILSKYNSVGDLVVGGTTNDASAKLQADSTTKGFLPPRMTTAQRTAIASPATGLIVFDTTVDKLYVKASGAWEAITSV
jgi:hypothetical protein